MKKNIVFPTQNELARNLRVSQMTISRVLNNQPGVGSKLKEKIFQKMERLGYIPNSIARGLLKKSTRIIGLIIPDITNSFFPEMTKSIEYEAKKKGYHVVLSHSDELYSREKEEINLLLGLRVEGLIIAPTGKQQEIDIYQKLKRLKIPFVFIDRTKKAINCNFVITDTRKGAYTLGRYLVEKGYRKWGYLRGPEGISSGEEHFEGLKKSLKEAGFPLNSIVSVQAGFFEEGGYRACQELLRKIKPDVIIGVNDPVAIGAYHFLKEKGIKIPENVALVGFSDIKPVDILESPLTTVREFPLTVGKRAVEVLFDEINEPGHKNLQEKVEPQLIIRKSG
ncbi:MAG: LacI family DNA-binding transcriptional regulator [Candidatus Omnitrophota bacterium]